MTKISLLPAIDPETLIGDELALIVKDGQLWRASLEDIPAPQATAAAARAETAAGEAVGAAEAVAAFGADPLGVFVTNAAGVPTGGYPVERSLRAEQTVTRFFAETDAASDIYVTVNGTAILYRTVDGSEAVAIEKVLAAGDEVTIWLASGEPTFFWAQIDKGTVA